ncbi:hypothetical protein ASF74_15015 [Arthrobacter sp. Leaf145]|nr:hypothetical protein ASF74_15015 [Arthrobacter sp. Leaf145]
MMARKLRRGFRVVAIAGVAALGVAAAGVAGFAVTHTAPPPAISEQVANYTPAPKPTHAPERMAVIGDSYAVGVGSGDMSLGWAPRLAWNQQWLLGNFARGGTGYVSEVADPAKAKIACGLDFCPNHEGMLPEVVAFQPTMVLVTGGRNDGWVPIEKATEQIRAFYADLRAKLPTAKIVAFNPVWDSNDVPPEVAALDKVIESAAHEVDGTYLDAGQPLHGKPDLLAADGKHPNGTGHRIVFEAYLAQLQRVGLADR